MLPTFGHAVVATLVADEARFENSVPLALPCELGGVMAPWEVAASPVR